MMMERLSIRRYEPGFALGKIEVPCSNAASCRCSFRSACCVPSADVVRPLLSEETRTSQLIFSSLL